MPMSSSAGAHWPMKVAKPLRPASIITADTPMARTAADSFQAGRIRTLRAAEATRVPWGSRHLIATGAGEHLQHARREARCRLLERDDRDGDATAMMVMSDPPK